MTHAMERLFGDLVGDALTAAKIPGWDTTAYRQRHLIISLMRLHGR